MPSNNPIKEPLPGTTVQPQGNGRILRIMSSLKEPEERMRSRGKVNIAGVRLDSRSRLTDSLFAWFLVPDGDVVGCREGLDASRFRGDLAPANMKFICWMS